MNTSGFATVNPANGEQIESFSFHNAAQIEAVLVRRTELSLVSQINRVPEIETPFEPGTGPTKE